MDEILKNMDEDKRNRVINAAIEQFALFPYDKASTNAIVKKAGISKGLLFHYFGNKKDMYEKLVGFVLNKLFNEISSQVDWDETDILERIKQMVLIKMEIGKRYPSMFEFIIQVINEKTDKSVESLKKIYEEYGIDIYSLTNRVYTENVDFTMFKDQSTIQMSINIVRWSLEKYGEEQLQAIKHLHASDYDRMAIEMDSYISVLQKAFY